MLRRHAWAGYSFGLGCWLAALLLTLLAEPLLSRTVFLLFIAATAATAWFAGRGPAILCIALSLLSADYFFVPPRGSLVPSEPADAIPLVGFAGIGFLIVWFAEIAARREQLLRQQTGVLQDHSTELEAQITNSHQLQTELEEVNERLADVNAEMARQRELLEEAQRSASIGSWEWDIPLSRVSWSDEMYRVFGLPPRSMSVDFDTFLRHVHPDDRDMVRTHIQNALERHESFRFEHRIVRPDGQVRWLEARGKVYLRHGAPIRMSGSGQDITERRRASESMRLLTEAYEALASSLDYQTALTAVANMAVRALADWCAIALGDDSGRFDNVAVAHKDPERQRWAEEFGRLHPPPADAPTGVPHVLRTGKTEYYPEITEEMLDMAQTRAEERRIVNELGLKSVIIAPMIARGRTIGAITFIASESGYRFTPEDVVIAERLAGKAASAIDNARLFGEAQHARAEAEEANRVKMDFLAAMSHELRTPLNAIAGYSQLLEMGLHGELSAKQRELVERLQRSQRHLLSLVEQVLGFARIEAGKVSIRFEAVPVEQALGVASEMLAPQIEARRLRYEMVDGAGTLRVRADPDRLQQILVNLLANAVKFTPEGGTVHVRAAGSAETVEISVRDTGVGIPPDQLERIFEPFVQLPQPTVKRATGVGLGLSISRDLARAMGGDIQAESALGKGSTFILRLPRAEG